YSSDGPAWTAGAENYLRYSVVKDTNGDFVLTARYILPLLEEQKLLLRVNGVSVGDSIIISPEASFGMLTFVIPGSQVNETGPNNLIFGSTGGVTTVNPSYVVSVVETVTKEGYTPSPIIYQGVDETAGEDWRTTSLKPYSISANNAYGMLGYIAWATGNTKDYNGSDINADNPIVSLPNGVTVTANGANQSYSAGYPLFNDPSETPDAVVTTINSGLIYRKDSLASTWRSMVDIQFGQTLTNTVRIGIIQNAGGDKLTGIRLSKAGDPTIYDEKLGLDTKNPSQIRYFAFDVTEIDSGDVFTVSLMGEDSNGDQLTTVGMSGLFFDVMDPIAPVISPVVNANVNVNEANSWMAPTTTATDNFYGDISSDIAISYSSADTGSNVIDLASARQHLGTVGNTVTATYNVTDASGNAATAVSATFTSVSEIYYQGVDETAGTDWRTTSLKPYSISSNNAYGMLGYIAWATGGNIDYNGSDINADHPIISLPNGITVTANGADESYSAGYPLFNDPSQAPGTTVSDINSGLIYRKDIQGGVWRSMVNINVGNTLGDNIRVGIIQNSGGDRLTGVRLSKVGSPSIYDEVTGLDTKNPSQLRYFVFDVAKMEAGDAFTISLMGEDSNGDQQTVVGMSGIFFDIPAGNVSAFSEYPEPVSALVPVSEVEPEARDGEMLISDLVLYPNPSTGVINIKSNEVLRRITIINTVGQLMLLRSTDENKIELNVERLPSGYYSVLMETESGKLITRRFIKE
ncbi:MAG: T9SS type A sorting domain-containing protein, partial [Bacteroidota bacterium]